MNRMCLERADILYSVELSDQPHNSAYSLMRFLLYLLTVLTELHRLDLIDWSALNGVHRLECIDWSALTRVH